MLATMMKEIMMDIIIAMYLATIRIIPQTTTMQKHYHRFQLHQAMKNLVIDFCQREARPTTRRHPRRKKGDRKEIRRSYLAAPRSGIVTEIQTMISWKVEEVAPAGVVGTLRKQQQRTEYH